MMKEKKKVSHIDNQEFELAQRLINNCLEASVSAHPIPIASTLAHDTKRIPAQNELEELIKKPTAKQVLSSCSALIRLLSFKVRARSQC